ncbi:MAG: hypothetical protein M1825_002253 [Sarcosagium campestre]|nr:MAG: hypothetical protein M1825_002253 [Sarcosagium campestre]
MARLGSEDICGSQSSSAEPPLPILDPGPSRAKQRDSTDDSGPGEGPIKEAATAVAACFGSSVQWAVVGGASVVALGSLRLTEDIDVVVYPPSDVKRTKDLLKNDARFTIEPRTRRTFFTDPTSRQRIDIDFLSYPGTFKTPFDASTELVQVGAGIRILTPPTLLESKCASLLSRSSDDKKVTDVADIEFLLEYMDQNGYRIRTEQVPSATKAFQGWLAKEYLAESVAMFSRVGL